VEAKNFILNDCCQRQVIKEFGKDTPNIGIAVLSQTLIVEAIHLGHSSGFVIASQDNDTVGKANLQGHQEGHSLYRVVAAIHIVTHEKVILIWRRSTNSKQFDQVMELSMDVSTDGHRSTHLGHIGLINQNFFCLFAESLNV
jgi:hypothetical protein